MNETFADVWRRVRLHAPSAGFALARSWTQQAYEDLCERRPWTWLRVYAQMVVPQSRTVTMTVTQYSPTVTSAGLFQLTDVGMQIVGQVISSAIYTIIAVSADLTTATLDIPYTDVSVTTPFVISGRLVTMPADFGAFQVILDPYNVRLIPYWFTQEDIGRIDPNRFSSDASPRALVSRQLSPVPATAGQMMYEWWPAPTQQKAFPFYYRKRPGLLQDTDPFVGVLANRGRILEAGALAHCALWPGTAEQKNPYYNVALGKMLQDRFEGECAKLELRDDDMMLDSWNTLPFHQWATWDLAGDTRYLRATDASVGDYRSGSY